MQRKKYDPNLPRNLTYRRRDKAYYWRNPLTKEEFTLGKISRRDAVAQAIEANHYIYKNYSPAALIEKLKGFDSFTMADWIERYKTILIRRKVSRNTYKIRVNQLETIKEKLGGILLTEITTRHIAEFLDLWIEGGK
ncbi:phage integrase Arm DNA-binding domain-containing protein, partial [Escherichia coli]